MFKLGPALKKILVKLIAKSMGITLSIEDILIEEKADGWTDVQFKGRVRTNDLDKLF